MAVVRIPTVLRKHTGGEAKLLAPGSTVREVFEDIAGDRPGLREDLFDGDQVRAFINVYVEDEDIRYLDGLDTEVEDGDEIAIMPAVAGGASPRRALVGQAEPSTHGAFGPAGGASPRRALVGQAEPSTHGAFGGAGGAEAEPSTHGAFGGAGGAV